VVRNNPGGDIYDILARPDIAGDLDRQLSVARLRAEAELGRAWPAAADLRLPYRARLESDLVRAYYEAASELRQAAIEAYQSVPSASFIPGVTRPGDNPMMEAANRRADEVARRTSAAAWRLGLRNQLTVEVAATRRAGEEVLARAEQGMLKKWKTRGDLKVCEWCRYLASQPAIPVDQEFSYDYAPRSRRQPPRIYLDLMCPPSHPRCRCRIILVRPGSSEELAVDHGESPLFIPAQSVRTLPEDRYQALREFHSAAMHELGQVLRRHREAGSE
jgi:hypothetical protein